MSQEPQLPHRFRESSFRRYEAIIQAAVTAHPQPFRVRCALYNLSSVTMSCRLRDAMKSFSQHKWPVNWGEATASLIAKFDRIYPHELKVCEVVDDGVIVIGQGSIKAQPSVLPVLTGSAPLHITYNPQTPQEKELLCNLASNRALAQPIKCTNFTPEEITHLEQKYDVSFDIHSDGSVTLI